MTNGQSKFISSDSQAIVSDMAEHLIGSEIIKLSNGINEKISEGYQIYNFTIGDFDPAFFPVPGPLLQFIIDALQEGHTNYPAANGMAELRQSISRFHNDYQGINYSEDCVLVASGARPLIYGIFKTLLDPGDKVIVPVPSWNNNHYCHLTQTTPLYINTAARDDFMPTASQLKPLIREANMIALCTPLNPTGTVIHKDELSEICELIISENRRRGPAQKPVYLLYDQIYWLLTYHNNIHYDPVSLFPEMQKYTIFVDGVSKCFAATGLRVGWALGPLKIINKMRAILSHIGAWAPKAEQIATSRFLVMKDELDQYLVDFKSGLLKRLQLFYDGFQSLKSKGFDIDVIPPKAAIYLTVKIDLRGWVRTNGENLKDTADITKFLLEEGGLGIVPFTSFGASGEDPWYRLSVGTCTENEVPKVLKKLNSAISTLKKVNIK